MPKLRDIAMQISISWEIRKKASSHLGISNHLYLLPLLFDCCCGKNLSSSPMLSMCFLSFTSIFKVLNLLKNIVLLQPITTKQNPTIHNGLWAVWNIRAFTPNRLVNKAIITTQLSDTINSFKCLSDIGPPRWHIQVQRLKYIIKYQTSVVPVLTDHIGNKLELFRSMYSEDFERLAG